MKRWTGLSRAASRRLRVPRSLTRWLAMGSGIDTRKHTTARWKITSDCLTAASRLARSRTSALSTVTWGDWLRFAVVPTDMSSSTVTWLDRPSKSTRWLPTNPAPPVTSTRFPSIFTPTIEENTGFRGQQWVVCRASRTGAHPVTQRPICPPSTLHLVWDSQVRAQITDTVPPPSNSAPHPAPPPPAPPPFHPAAVLHPH